MRKTWWLPVLAIGAAAVCVAADSAHAQVQGREPSLAELRTRAQQGDAEAQYKLGRMYALGEGLPQDHEQAVAWSRKAADQGHAKAQNNLGVAYNTGQGVAQDHVQAVAWLRKAADQGQPAAQCNLGFSYYTGQGVAQDYAQAATWFRKAAEQGYADAQQILGWMFEHGHGVPQDPVQAAAWLRKAAEQGNAWAQNSLGVKFGAGLGVPQDSAQAVEWFREAAEQGLANALYNLGETYGAGVGVPRDDVESLKWYIVAEARATADDQKQFADRRDQLARTLTPEQTAEAQRRARAWTEAFALRQAPAALHTPPPPVAQPPLQLSDVRVTPEQVRPGASFRLEVAYVAAAPATSGKVAVTLIFSILSGGKVLIESPGEIVESASGEAWKITKALTAAPTPGAYVIRVRLALGETVVTRDVGFEITR